MKLPWTTELARQLLVIRQLSCLSFAQWDLDSLRIQTLGAHRQQRR